MICTKIFSFRSIFIYNLMPNMLLFFCIVSCATDTWLLVSYSLYVLLGFTNGKELIQTKHDAQFKFKINWRSVDLSVL